MLRKLALSLAVAGAIATSNANALGLGEIKINSALNEPLQAEIQLLQMRDVDPQQIQPRMANIDDFALAGIEKLRFLSDVDFQVKPGPGGRGTIILTSNSAVKEPFLNFLVEVNWPSGRLVREYTVLLDPPVYDPTPSRTPATIQPAQAAPVATPAPVTSSQMADKPVDNIRTRMTDEQIYVDVNDTLWNLAKKYKPDASISEAQMMLALQRKNPDAFRNNNVNELKAGVVMNLPSMEEIKKLNRKQASDEFWRQTQIWKQGGRVSAQPEQMDGSGTGDKPGKDAAEKKADEVAAASADGQLKIVSPSKTADSGVASDQAEAMGADQAEAELVARNKELEAELATALESVDQIQRQNEELSGRVDALAQQMESLQRLLELKDQQLAELQAELDAAKSQPVTAAPAPAAESKPAGLLEQFGTYIYAAGAAVVALLLLLLVMLRRKKDPEAKVEEPVPGQVIPAVEETAAAEEQVAEEPVEDVVEDVIEEAVEEELSETDLDDLDLDMDLDEVDSADNTSIDDDEFDLGLDDIDTEADLTAEPVAEETLEADQLEQDDEVDDALDSILGEDTESMDLDDLDIDTVDDELADLVAESEEEEPDEDTPDSLEDLLEADEAEEELEFDVKPAEEAEPEFTEELTDTDELEVDFNLDAGPEADTADGEDALDEMLADDAGELDDLDALLDEAGGDVADEADSADEFADLEELLEESDLEEAPAEVADEDEDDEIADLDELLASVDEEADEVVESELEAEIKAEEIADEPVAEEADLHPELEQLLEDAMDDEIVLEEEEISPQAVSESGSDDLDAQLDSELEQLLGGTDSDSLSLEELDTEADDDDSFDGLNLLEGADEVETKLDLARAYIDMEDYDGAKDILEEIKKEGSEAQQQEADSLLENIKS